MCRVHHLKDKLRLLYKLNRNPDITQNKQLADCLGITPPNISQWTESDHIPEDHFDKVLALFNLEKSVLLKQDLVSFKEAIGPDFAPASTWEKLWQQAEFVSNDRGKLALVQRGVSHYPGDDNLRGPSFRVGDQFRLWIEGPKNWHVAVFLQDPKSISCLCPLETFCENNRLYLPAEPPLQLGLMLPEDDSPPFEAERPVGQHWWVVAFLAKPLPDYLKVRLMDTSGLKLADALEQLVWELDKQGSEASFVLRLPFGVLRE